jgi:hypothetical protein
MGGDGVLGELEKRGLALGRGGGNEEATKRTQHSDKKNLRSEAKKKTRKGEKKMMGDFC